MDNRAAGTLLGGVAGGLVGGPAGAAVGAGIGYGAGAASESSTDPQNRKKKSKRELKDEYGTANFKQIEKIRDREALADAAKYERKAERQEALLNSPEFMAQKMAEARRAAVADLSRAPTGGQQAELARLALSDVDPAKASEIARQSSLGQAQAASQAAAQQGFQAGQAAAQAERAMLDQLRERQNALLASVGEPPVTFAEKTGQGLVTSGVEMGMGALANELDVARIAGAYKRNPETPGPTSEPLDTENA